MLTSTACRSSGCSTEILPAVRAARSKSHEGIQLLLSQTVSLSIPGYTTIDCKACGAKLMRLCCTQAQLTELDGQKLARGAEEGTRRVLRSEAEAQAAAERVAAASLAVKAASRKVSDAVCGMGDTLPAGCSTAPPHLTKQLFSQASSRIEQFWES